MMSAETIKLADEAATTEAGRLGLSGRLLILTIGFVMLAEILIYVPSIANFRRNWLNDRISGAQMVTMFLANVPGGRLPPSVEQQVLEAIKARAIAVRGEGTGWLMMREGALPSPVRTIDLRDPPWHALVAGAFVTLLDASPVPVRVLGEGMGRMGWVEIIMDERPLRDAMLMFSRNILILSLFISLITAGLVYLALHIMIVRPVRRLSGNIAAFASNPEDGARIIVPSSRTDEIGLAEQALARMETALAAELRQKRRLADLGLAVSKINHELRNMLTTAQLLSDRLTGLVDPVAQTIGPRLMLTLGRAIDFCEATLAYGRARERVPERRLTALAPIVAELVGEGVLTPDRGIGYEVDVVDDLVVDTDPEQLSRILANLIRNAIQALVAAGATHGAPMVAIAGRREGNVVRIVVADNGPGIPAHVRDRMFSAFQGSTRAGGTGLGLPIADELVRLHGGTIEIEEAPSGARFCITIPDRAPG